MGKFLMVLLLPLFISNSITTYAADFTREQTGNRKMGVKKQIYPDGTYSLFSEPTIHYGAYMPPDPQTEAKVLIRSIWYFDIPANLPTGSYVKKVELIWNTNSSQSFYLGYVTDYPLDPNLQQKWELTENAIFLKALVGSNG